MSDDLLLDDEEIVEEEEETEEAVQGELDGVEGEPAPEVEILDEIEGSVRCTLAKTTSVYGKNDRVMVVCSTVLRRDVECALSKMAEHTVRMVEPPRGVPRPSIEAFGTITQKTEITTGKKRIKISIECEGLEEGVLDFFKCIAQTTPPDILLIPTQQELPETEPTENG